MKIENSFTVDTPDDKAWTLLTNIAEIAPCLPGANLTGEEGGVYTGTVKVKVGPVTAEYKGTAEFVEKDDVAHKAVINGKGRDSRGAGNAQAIITAEMEQVGDQTRVDIVTDLKISGKVAQFGRGVMQDVSEKLLGQFADCLAAKLDDPGSAEEEVTETHSMAATMISPPPVSAPVSEGADDEEVLDLLDVAGGAVAKRAIPTALTAAAVIAFIIWLINRSRVV